MSLELMFDGYQSQSEQDIVSAWRRAGPRTGTIELEDSAGHTVATYYLENAWPAQVEHGERSARVTLAATDIRRLPWLATHEWRPPCFAESSPV